VIVIDTSAVIAIANNESEAEACIAVLTKHDEALISAGTLLEIFIVAARKDISQSARDVLSNMLYVTVDVTEHFARLAGEAYTQWGKGFHPAGLNFGDCFAYALAKECNCPLLFIGNDFSQTDIKSALAPEEDPA
jgi:ribonuclease VapC